MGARAGLGDSKDGKMTIVPKGWLLPNSRLRLLDDTGRNIGKGIWKRGLREETSRKRHLRERAGGMCIQWPPKAIWYHATLTRLG